MGDEKKNFYICCWDLAKFFHLFYLGSNFRRIPTTIFEANWVLKKKLNWNKHLFSPVLIITRASCQHALLCDLTPSFQQLTSLFWAWCRRRCRKTTESPHPWLSRLVSVPLFIVYRQNTWKPHSSKHVSQSTVMIQYLWFTTIVQDRNSNYILVQTEATSSLFLQLFLVNSTILEVGSVLPPLPMCGNNELPSNRKSVN